MPGLTAGCSPVRCGGGAGGTVRLSVRSCVPGGSVSTVLLPCGVLVLLAVVWAELPALRRWVLGGPRSDRCRPAGRRGRRGSRSRRPGRAAPACAAADRRGPAPALPPVRPRAGRRTAGPLEGPV